MQGLNWIRAAALTLALAPGALPLAAEPGADAPWEAAIARLDFAAALDALASAIEADPKAAAPRLARAALHVKMQRPALALADLNAAIAADPGAVDALLARAEIYQSQRAWDSALADLDAALALTPDHAGLLARRAGLRAISGRKDAALADYTAALALTPEDSALIKARDRLVAGIAEARAAKIRFAPDAVMAREFQVVEGAEDAPQTLHFVHAATDLGADYAGIDRTALTRATESGALRIVHLFTYTGESGSIWGNLAAICAGSEGYAAAHAALAGASGREALTAAGKGNLTPLETLLDQIADTAGLDAEALRSCALYRARAAQYLADWQTHRDAGSWRGINLLDHWPVLVLDGVPLGPRALTDRLAAIAPAPDTEAPKAPETADTPDETPQAPDTGDNPATDAGDNPAPDAGDETAPEPAASSPDQNAAPASEAPAPAPAEGAAPTSETPAPAPQTGAPASAQTGAPASPSAPEQPLFPVRPQPAEDARVPVALRGVYAPSLAACLSYLNRIENPTRIDTVLPPVNPPGGSFDATLGADPDQPLLGTILVTSRRAYLFNMLDTECAISGDKGKEANWRGDFACTSPLAPDATPALQIAPKAMIGGAPRISARFGAEDPVTLRQCRALGQLGRAFAPLWSRDAAGCRVSVPLAGSRLGFSLDPEGALLLRVAPGEIPVAAGSIELGAAIDGTPPPGGTPGKWDGEAWQLSLGPFETAAERLGWGMFLDLRGSGDGFEARLPLFGSSAAMKKLKACAPGTE